MTGTDRYTDAIAHLRDVRPRTEAEHLQAAQVHTTLARAAATTLQAILPLVGGDSEEVTAWARLLLPDAPPHGPRRYTAAEWAQEQGEDAPALPLVTGVDGTIRVENAARLSEPGPVLHVEANRAGDELTPEMAHSLGLALLAWARRNKEVPW